MQDLNVGQHVIVKNNAPKPPKHHHKKLKEWESKNFNGEITEIDLIANNVRVKNLDSSNAVIEYNFWINLDRSDMSIHTE